MKQVMSMSIKRNN